MLFVEAHNWDFVSAERRAYVTTVCVKTGFEIFDSVDMLSLITDQQQEEVNCMLYEIKYFMKYCPPQDSFLIATILTRQFLKSLEVVVFLLFLRKKRGWSLILNLSFQKVIFVPPGEI